MEESNKGMGLIILGIVAVTAVVGLILLFNTTITGAVARQNMPTAGALGLTCVDKSGDLAISIKDYSINKAAQICTNKGGHLVSEVPGLIIPGG